MSKRAWGGVGVVVLVGLAAVWRLSPGTELPSARAQIAPQAVPVTAGVVATADVPQFLYGIGTVQAFNSVAIKARVDGQIVGVAFAEGQEVRRGDALIKIDPRPYQASLEQAQAAKEKDEAQLATAQSNLVRYGRLVGPGFQTRQSFEEQQGTVAQLQAVVKGDQAQIDTATLNLNYTDIKAPIDGRLGSRLVDIGNMVHANDNTPLVTIAQIRPIFVSFTLPQSALDGVRHYQQQAPLDVIALSGDDATRLAEGKLTLIDNTIDQATGTIHLKAAFPNQDERLWPGEFVNVRLVLMVRRGVATVPAQAVMQGPSGDFAYVIKANDTVERRVIEVAARQDGLAVIGKGLTVGERIVVEGQYRLTEGTRVTPRQSASPGSSS